jgi:hypothetical protein
MTAKVVAAVSLLNKSLQIHRAIHAAMANLQINLSHVVLFWSDFSPPLDQTALQSMKTAQSAKNGHTRPWAFQDPVESLRDREQYLMSGCQNTHCWPEGPADIRQKCPQTIRWAPHFQSWGNHIHSSLDADIFLSTTLMLKQRLWTWTLKITIEVKFLNLSWRIRMVLGSYGLVVTELTAMGTVTVCILSIGSGFTKWGSMLHWEIEIQE